MRIRRPELKGGSIEVIGLNVATIERALAEAEVETMAGDQPGVGLAAAHRAFQVVGGQQFAIRFEGALRQGSTRHRSLRRCSKPGRAVPDDDPDHGDCRTGRLHGAGQGQPDRFRSLAAQPSSTASSYPRDRPTA